MYTQLCFRGASLAKLCAAYEGLQRLRSYDLCIRSCQNNSGCFVQVSASGNSIAIDDTDISWKSDRQKQLGPVSPQYFNTDPAVRGGAELTGLLDQDEHFIVWMRPATTGDFRKLYGRITQDLPASSSLDVTINDRYKTCGTVMPNFGP